MMFRLFRKMPATPLKKIRIGKVRKDIKSINLIYKDRFRVFTNSPSFLPTIISRILIFKKLRPVFISMTNPTKKGVIIEERALQKLFILKFDKRSKIKLTQKKGLFFKERDIIIRKT